MDTNIKQWKSWIFSRFLMKSIDFLLVYETSWMNFLGQTLWKWSVVSFGLQHTAKVLTALFHRPSWHVHTIKPKLHGHSFHRCFGSIVSLCIWCSTDNDTLQHKTSVHTHTKCPSQFLPYTFALHLLWFIQLWCSKSVHSAAHRVDQHQKEVFDWVVSN